VDGGQEPDNDFIREAELGLIKYGVYDLQSAFLSFILYDNEAKHFVCKVEGAVGDEFEIQLS